MKNRYHLLERRKKKLTGLLLQHRFYWELLFSFCRFAICESILLLLVWVETLCRA